MYRCTENMPSGQNCHAAISVSDKCNIRYCCDDIWVTPSGKLQHLLCLVVQHLSHCRRSTAGFLLTSRRNKAWHQ